MSDIQIVRPVFHTDNEENNWIVDGSGGMHGVLSDQSDATHLEGGKRLLVGGGSTISGTAIVALAAHTLPAGHRRHQWRIHSRSKVVATTGSFNVRADHVPTGGGTGFSRTITVGTTITEDNSPFSTSIAFLGSPQTFWLRIVRKGTVTLDNLLELKDVWVTIDSRAKPTFTADVVDGAGVSQIGGVVDDTNRPTFKFTSPAYDGLAARNWSLTVVDDLTQGVAFSASGSGTPPAEILSDPLASRAFTATLQISSTVRANDEFPSDVATLQFSVDAAPAITTSTGFMLLHEGGLDDTSAIYAQVKTGYLSPEGPLASHRLRRTGFLFSGTTLDTHIHVHVDGDSVTEVNEHTVASGSQGFVRTRGLNRPRWRMIQLHFETDTEEFDGDPGPADPTYRPWQLSQVSLEYITLSGARTNDPT